MGRIKAYVLKLKTPSVLFAIIYSILSLMVIGGTITLICLDLANAWFTYIFYGLSAISLVYLVYIVIYFTPKVRDKVIAVMKKHKFSNELLESYGYRSVVFASFSFVLNVAYAVFQGVFAILSGSIWYGALAIYYIVLSCIRGGIVGVSRKRKNKKEEFGLEKQVRAYRNCGIYLVVLNFALVAAVVQMVIINQGYEYAGLMIYVMATYTFYKLTMSIINIVRARKHNDYTIQSIKNISFADALVSVLGLQTAMFIAFGDGFNPRIPNSITGGAVSIAIIVLGIVMIIRGNIKLNKLKKGENK